MNAAAEIYKEDANQKIKTRMLQSRDYVAISVRHL